MLPYTLGNCFSYGYGEGVFNPEDKTVGNFWCKYSRCTRKPESFRVECVDVAKRISAIADAQNRVPYIMLSGGLDSEVVVQAFLEAGTKFKTITYAFENQLNSHELRFVNAFVKEHKLDHEYLSIDVLNWIHSEEAKKLFEESGADNFSLVPHMKLMNHIWFDLGGLPVMGDGELYFEKTPEGWQYMELERLLAWSRHAIKNKIHAVPGFYQFTPEIMLSMLYEPKIQRLGLNQDAFADKMYQTSWIIKYSIYRKHWPTLKSRPKFGGMEQVAEQFTARANELFGAKRQAYSDKFICSYADLRGMLEP